MCDLFQSTSLERHQHSLISTSGFREQTPETRNGLSQWGNINLAENKMRGVSINCNTCVTCSTRALLNATNSHLLLLPVSENPPRKPEIKLFHGGLQLSNDMLPFTIFNAVLLKKWGFSSNVCFIWTPVLRVTLHLHKWLKWLTMILDYIVLLLHGCIATRLFWLSSVFPALCCK